MAANMDISSPAIGTSDQLLSDLESEILKLNLPLLVNETRHSTRRSSDRANLVRVVESLASKTCRKLRDDAKIHKRYATKAAIMNQVKSVSKTAIYETIPLVLPVKQSSWNDLSEEDLQYEILRSVLHIHDQYKWHNVRIRFDHFISASTKELLDSMDSDQEPQNDDECVIVREVTSKGK